jgi:hypothetical protein
MANTKQLLDWLKYGAIAGGIIGLVLPFIIGLIVNQTGITGITFATYDVRTQLTSFAANGNIFASWVASMVGLSLPGGTVWGVVITAIGLGVAMALVRFLVGLFNIDLGKNKHMWIALLSAAAVGAVVSGNISAGLPAFQFAPMIFFAATGWLVAYVMAFAYKMFDMALPQ